MYEFKKWKGIYELICWDRAHVLWKKNLPGRGLTKVEKPCPSIRNILRTSDVRLFVSF